jgi:hypothetical protein
MRFGSLESFFSVSATALKRMLYETLWFLKDKGRKFSGNVKTA